MIWRPRSFYFYCFYVCYHCCALPSLLYCCHVFVPNNEWVRCQQSSGPLFFQQCSAKMWSVARYGGKGCVAFLFIYLFIYLFVILFHGNCVALLNQLNCGLLLGTGRGSAAFIIRIILFCGAVICCCSTAIDLLIIIVSEPFCMFAHNPKQPRHLQCFFGGSFDVVVNLFVDSVACHCKHCLLRMGTTLPL